MSLHWYKVTDNSFPDFGEPVLLSKSTNDNIIRECRIVEEDITKEKAWLVGDNYEVISLDHIGLFY